MRKIGIFVLVFSVAAMMLTGCRTKRLASEDLEVQELYADDIAVLKDPNLHCNSKEKYEAAKHLVSKVDFTMTRESKTLDELLYYGDAIVGTPGQEVREVAFQYEYQDKIVRLTFMLVRNFVVRAEELQR